MRKIASVDTISTDCITYIGNGEALEAQWVSDESSDDTEDDAKDHIITTNITTYELFTQPRNTQKVLDDPAIEAERWLIEQAALAFTQLENEAFITGNAENKSHGILKYNDCYTDQICKITSSTACKTTAEDILQLHYSLLREFSVNCTFLMNSASIQIVRGLKYEQTEHYMFQPSLRSGEPDTLMGIAVVECAEMPIIPTKSATPRPCPIMFGDFRRSYQIINRNEMRVLGDPYSVKPYISFYITKRVGGEVINPNAFALLEMKAS